MNNSDMPSSPSTNTYDCDGDSLTEVYTGLTKREHFAGLAMQGICANRLTINELAEHANGGSIAGLIAKLSTVYADRLLKELEK